nr:dehydration-responsive element-binding protein 1A-like [Lolium perenne]
MRLSEFGVGDVLQVVATAQGLRFWGAMYDMVGASFDIFPKYIGVRLRPSGRFDAEIPSGEKRILLGTFDTAHEAARTYDVAAWCLSRSRRHMNFHDVWTRDQEEQLAPPSPVITREQQRRARELEQRLRIAEQDECLRLEWARQFPEDVAAMEAFYTHKEEQKARRWRRRRRTARSSGRSRR